MAELARVAILSPYALSVAGGVQAQTIALSRELGRRGTEVLLLAPDVTDLSDHDSGATVATFGRRASLPANGSRAPLTLSLAASRAAARRLEAFSPDVVHVHEPFAPVLGYATLHRHRCAAVGTFHRSGGGPALSLTGPLLRRLARGLDDVVAVSPAAAATIAGPSGLRPDVLFNGLETSWFRAVPREVTSRPVVLFVGRLEPRKGCRTVAEAARILHGRGRDLEVILAGDGPQRRELEAEFAHDVRFLGRVSEEDKRSWLRRASVAVAASVRGESFGLVVLEPMAAETPVVVSDIDGYREAATGHGTMFRPGDASSLADAIESSLSNGVDKVPAARAHAEEWSSAHLVDRYLEHYERARSRFAHG